jgi:hypothetical protein
MKSQWISICLVCLVYEYDVTDAMAPLLSPLIVNGIVGTLNNLRILHNHSASLDAVDIALNSDSIVDVADTSCCLEHHMTAPPHTLSLPPQLLTFCHLCQSHDWHQCILLHQAQEPFSYHLSLCCLVVGALAYLAS